MQVIEKVKVVPEGYNGAGMDGMYGRRDVNGKANAGLTLGIIRINLSSVKSRERSPQVSIMSIKRLVMLSMIEPLTNEQRNMLATNEEYVANYNNLQSMVQAEVLNLVRANIENSPEGKALLDNQLKLVKNLKTSIIEMSQREMQLFNAFKEASAKNPSLTYEEFIKTMK